MDDEDDDPLAAALPDVSAGGFNESLLVQMCLLLREQTEQRLALHDAIQRGDVTAQRRCHRVLDEIALRASRLGVPGM